jgi:AraC-like DNA-binding protein
MRAAPSHHALAPFVTCLWVSRTGANACGVREHVLPTGQMHVVFRLSGPPLRLFENAVDCTGHTIAGPVVGGVRARYYSKAVHDSVLCVGAQLKPGAAQALFGVSAAELAQRHTVLADIWGGFANAASEQLAAAHSPRAQVALLQDLLLERLRPHRGPPLEILHAVAALRQPCRVEQIVQGSTYSHRGFITQFKHATGLSPKRYARLMRFQALLEGLKRLPRYPLADLAVQMGYSDQAHMTREFREFSGVTPAQYRALAPAATHHVVLPAGSNLFKPRT